MSLSPLYRCFSSLSRDEESTDQPPVSRRSSVSQVVRTIYVAGYDKSHSGATSGLSWARLPLLMILLQVAG